MLVLKGARCKTLYHNTIIAQVGVAHQATSKAAAPLRAKILEVKQKNSHNKDNTSLYRNNAARKIPTFQRTDSTYLTRRR